VTNTCKTRLRGDLQSRYEFLIGKPKKRVYQLKQGYVLLEHRLMVGSVPFADMPEEERRKIELISEPPG